jgi:hypothetical protein
LSFTYLVPDTVWNLSGGGKTLFLLPRGAGHI